VAFIVHDQDACWSVAMLEKFALLKIALCKAPVFSRASECRTSPLTSAGSAMLVWAACIYLVPLILLLTLSLVASTSIEDDRRLERGHRQCGLDDN
jgi:hypothetical protein